MYTSYLSTLATISLLSFSAQAAPLSSLTRRADLCASEGRVYYAQGQCSSGFAGCAPANATAICGGERRYYNDCAHQAFNLGSWYVCNSNGFVGCHTRDACQLGGNKPVTPETKKPETTTPEPKKPENTTPETKKPETNTPKPSTWSCPEQTTYLAPGYCSSGFVGCHPWGAGLCQGEKKYYSDCPAGTGVFQHCANGFVGCSTNTNMCG